MQQSEFIVRRRSARLNKHASSPGVLEGLKSGFCGKDRKPKPALKCQSTRKHHIGSQKFAGILGLDGGNSAESASNIAAKFAKPTFTIDPAMAVKINHEKPTIPFSCPQCDTVSPSYKGLQQHRAKTHECSEKSAICEQCGKGFKHKYALKFHIRQVHEKSTRVECDLCGQSVYNKYMLATHKLVCNGTTEFSCPHCSTECRNFKGLQQHLAKVHLSWDKPAGCEECGKRFKHKHALKLHVRQVHERATRVMCELCGCLLYNKYKLEQHSRACPGAT